MKYSGDSVVGLCEGAHVPLSADVSRYPGSAAIVIATSCFPKFRFQENSTMAIASVITLVAVDTATAAVTSPCAML